jgi:hypothetical protein
MNTRMWRLQSKMHAYPASYPITNMGMIKTKGPTYPSLLSWDPMSIRKPVQLICSHLMFQFQFPSGHSRVGNLGSIGKVTLRKAHELSDIKMKQLVYFPSPSAPSYLQ